MLTVDDTTFPTHAASAATASHGATANDAETTNKTLKAARANQNKAEEEDDCPISLAASWNYDDHAGLDKTVAAATVTDVPVMHHGTTTAIPTTNTTTALYPHLHHHDPLYEIDDVELSDFLMDAMPWKRMTVVAITVLAAATILLHLMTTCLESRRSLLHLPSCCHLQHMVMPMTRIIMRWSLLPVESGNKASI